MTSRNFSGVDPYHSPARSIGITTLILQKKLSLDLEELNNLLRVDK